MICGINILGEYNNFVIIQILDIMETRMKYILETPVPFEIVVSPYGLNFCWVGYIKLITWFQRGEVFLSGYIDLAEISLSLGA